MTVDEISLQEARSPDSSPSKAGELDIEDPLRHDLLERPRRSRCPSCCRPVAKRCWPPWCWPKSRRAKLGCILLRVVIWFFVLLTLAVVLRHLSRGAGLGELTRFVETAKPCLDATTGRCSLVASPEDNAHFDLGPGRRNLLGWLYLQMLHASTEDLRTILMGGHAVVPDGNLTVYKFLIDMPRSYRRTSSHKSDQPQYAVKEGRFLSTILMGHWHGNSWFQLEGAPWQPRRYPWLSFFHVLDYYEYRVTRRNVGPFGTSAHTDWRPLRLSAQPAAAAEVCPEKCPVHVGDEETSDLRVLVLQEPQR